MLRLLQTEAGRRIQLQILMNLAAKATGQRTPYLLGMPSEKALEFFARFTALHLPQPATQQERLYTEAYHLGSLLRKILHVKTNEQLTQTAILLYRNIGIDMQGSLPGEVCVNQCFFSNHYTPGICTVASLMDAGVICGLAQGTQLQFTHRITEGCTKCKAILTV